MDICMSSIVVMRRYDMREGCAILKSAGFDGVDWAVGMDWRRTGMQDWFLGDMDALYAHFDPEIAAIREAGLKIGQAHAPFPAFMENVPTHHKTATEIYKKIIPLCARAGCPQIVIHGVGRSTDFAMTEREVRELNLNMYKTLIPEMKKHNIRVLLENLFFTSGGRHLTGFCSDAEDAVYYIDTLNDMAGQELFGLCLDTGHLNLLYKPMRKYIESLGRRIKALHIHDNTGNTDRHMAPYTGDVRWDDFCSALHDIGYTGDITFESTGQTSIYRVPDALVPSWLKLTYDCGKYFKKIIEN